MIIHECYNNINIRVVNYVFISHILMHQFEFGYDICHALLFLFYSQLKNNYYQRYSLIIINFIDYFINIFNIVVDIINFLSYI